MAHTISARKRIRQSEKRRLSNKSAKSKLRTFIKKYSTSIVEGNIEDAEKSFQTSLKLLYSAAGKNIIHKNQAARRASRMAKRLNALKAANANKA